MHALYVIEYQMHHRHWQRSIYDIVVVNKTTPITPTTPSPTGIELQPVEQMKTYRLPDNLRSIYDIGVNETTPVKPTTPSPTGTVLQQVEQMKAYRLPDNLWDPTAVLLRDPPPEMVSRITRARKVYLTFGHKCCSTSKARACKAARNYVDECLALDMSDLDPEFRHQNSMSLQTQRGGGLWLWKPYLINKTLHALSDGDYVMYADTGSYLTGPIEPLLVLLERQNDTLNVYSPLESAYHSRSSASVTHSCGSVATRQPVTTQCKSTVPLATI
jgi:hypothetical protein